MKNYYKNTILFHLSLKREAGTNKVSFLKFFLKPIQLLQSLPFQHKISKDFYTAHNIWTDLVIYRVF